MKDYLDDQPAGTSYIKRDTLKRTNLAKDIANLIVLDPEKPCFTVSIEGAWGIGKTTIVNLIRNSLSHMNTSPIVIDYNPWQSPSKESKLHVQDFLVQFSSQLRSSGNDNNFIKATNDLIAYSHLFNLMKYVPGVEPWASVLEGFTTSARLFAKTRKEKEELEKLNIKKQKEIVKNSIRELNKPIVVIIDDIDRLLPDELFEIIRLIKSIADFERTCFLLCYDPHYISHVLEKYNIHNPSTYLEKIVQLRIPVPIFSYADLEAVTDKYLDELLTQVDIKFFDEDQDRLVYVYGQYIKYIIKTPRDVKRIVNNLKFILSKTKHSVCFTDLFCLSVILVKHPNIYDLIRSDPELFVGRPFEGKSLWLEEQDIVERRKETLDEELDKIKSKIDRYNIKTLLQEIFPLLSPSHFSSFSTNYDKNGRVASIDRLYTALHFQVPTGYASDIEAIAFINESSKRNIIIEKAIQNKSLDHFLDILEYKLELIAQQDVYEILVSLFFPILSSRYFIESDKKPYGLSGTVLIGKLNHLSLTIIGSVEEKKELLLKLFNHKNLLPITSRLMRDVLKAWDNLGNLGTSNFDLQSISADDFDKIKSTWTNNAVEYLMEDNDLDYSSLSRIYFVLKHISITESNLVLNYWIEKKEDIKTIANIIGRTGTDSHRGAYCQIDLTQLDSGINKHKLSELAQKTLESDLQNRPEVSAVCKSIGDGRKYYLIDGSEASIWDP